VASASDPIYVANHHQFQPRWPVSQVTVMHGQQQKANDAGGAIAADPLSRFAVWMSALLAAGVLRLAHATWRTDVKELEKLDTLRRAGRRVLVVFWHGKYFPLFPLMAGRQARIFSSPSFRGAVVAELSRRFGNDGVILPAESGKRPRAAMVEALRDASLAALIVDGPLGPYHKVKRGALDVCSQLGFVILPVSAAGARQWVMEKRWDKREFPKPFTRVAMTVGDPIAVPSPLAPGAVRVLKQRLQESLEGLDRRAAEMARPPGNADRPKRSAPSVAAHGRERHAP